MLNQDEMLTDFQFSPDGLSIALVLGDEIVEIRKMETGARSQELEWADRTGPIYWIEFDDQWEQVVWVSRSNVLLQNLSTPERSIVLVHEDTIRDTDFAPDGMYFASTSAKQINGGLLPVVQIWDSESGTEYLSIPLEQTVTKIEYSTDGSLLFVGLRDGGIQVYNPLTGEKFNSFTGHNDEILGILMLDDGSLLATVSRDGEISVWATSD
jgi:WD40 repeat protein